MPRERNSSKERWRARIVASWVRREDFDAALRHAEQFRQGNPLLFWSELECAAALGALGRNKEASAALKRVEKLRPGFCKTPGRFLRCHIMQDEIVDAVLQGLQVAGLKPANTGSKSLTAETSYTTAQ